MNSNVKLSDPDEKKEKEAFCQFRFGNCIPDGKEVVEPQTFGCHEEDFTMAPFWQFSEYIYTVVMQRNYSKITPHVSLGSWALT